MNLNLEVYSGHWITFYFQFTGGESKANEIIRTHFLMFPSLSYKLLLLLLVALEVPLQCL